LTGILTIKDNKISWDAADEIVTGTLLTTGGKTVNATFAAQPAKAAVAKSAVAQSLDAKPAGPKPAAAKPSGPKPTTKKPTKIK
jgi:cell division septation protein DedD